MMVMLVIAPSSEGIVPDKGSARNLRALVNIHRIKSRGWCSTHSAVMLASCPTSDGIVPVRNDEKKARWVRRLNWLISVGSEAAVSLGVKTTKLDGK